ncbi:MAG: PHP domain-containing protein [Clostridiales bacterium]|nr:PHP domain-containing protein [Clostridiales bacterium]
MRVFYDFHLHSCLSPCGSDDMTPNNLVNMACLLGYDVIALTDHNSCLNTPAAVQVGQKAGVLVIPGMELCTREEAHVVCLFPNVGAAMEFNRYVAAHGHGHRNRPEIFGEQWIMDENDSIVGKEESLLLDAADIGAGEAADKARSLGGTAFPAHVDRSSYSVISSLGSLPEEAKFTAVEISRRGDVRQVLKANPELNGKLLLFDSDAHRLEDMPEPRAWLELPEKTPECLISVLNGERETVSGNG